MDEALYRERVQIREDMLAGRVPRRVSIQANFTLEAACSFSGVDMMRAHYDVEQCEKALDSICAEFFSDCCPAGDIRFPPPYQILGAKNWQLGTSGALQHPEIEIMEVADYEGFTAAPYDYMVEKLLPRMCRNLDTDDANARALTLGKAFYTYNKIRSERHAMSTRLAQKHGYAPGLVTGQVIEAPFDFLADQLRGFKGITMDIRRMPEKVEAAVNAITPLMLKLGTPPRYNKGAINMIALHLAPYINQKHFERLFWPSLLEMVCELDRRGIRCYLYAEQDWTRFAEYMEQLPESAIVLFELGDSVRLKSTVGKKHLMGGFYDATMTLTKSREECIDAAKRLLDDCMEGGRFFFAFEKSIMDIKSVDAKKLQAVLDWVHLNATY